METFETIIRRRAVRQFIDKPLPDEVLIRILQAGRWAGSAKNTQPWHFIVVRQRETLDSLATCGHYAGHLRGAAAAVVIVTESSRWAGIDSGRAAQNMMLAAWAEGVGSCVAALHDEECARFVLGVPQKRVVQFAISFGYPDPDAVPTIEGRPLEKVLVSRGRRPLQEIVHWEKWSVVID
jgi:nitroreductase